MIHDYLVNGTKEMISPLDRGFAYGDGVFRTLKVRYGKPLGWDFHYQKLESDCRKLGIVAPEQDLFLSDIHKMLEENKTDSTCVIKLMVTRGKGDRGYKYPTLSTPVRVTIKSAMPNYDASYADIGVTLYQCETVLSHQSKLAGIKHLNRLENVLARNEWSDHRYFDGLMLDREKRVIECTSANVFIRNGNQLITPELNLCGVAGVTRDLILSFGQALELEARADTISLEALMQADEVIICNSLYGAFQVIKFNDKEWTPQPLAVKCRDLLNRVYAFV